MFSDIETAVESVLSRHLFSLATNSDQPWTQGDLLNRPLIAKCRYRIPFKPATYNGLFPVYNK